MGQRWKHGNKLPQMNGSGMVRNLRAAMSLAGTQGDALEALFEGLEFAPVVANDVHLPQQAIQVF